MTIDLFDAQIEARRDNDTRQFEQAFEELASILKPMADRPSAEIRNALNEIVACLGGRLPDLPLEAGQESGLLGHYLRPTGILHRRVVLSGEWWKNAVGPMLGSTRSGQVVALLPGRAFGYFFRHPNGQPVRIDRKAAQDLNPEAFCFYRPLPPDRLSLIDVLRFMLQSVTLYDFLFVLGASTLVSVLGLFLPFMNKILFDTVVPSGLQNLLLPVAALLLGVTLGSALFGMTRGIILLRLQHKIGLALQSAMIMRMLSLPALFFKHCSAGDLSSRLAVVPSLVGTISNVALTSLLSALFSLIYLVQIRSFTPTLLLPALTVLAISLAVSIGSTFLRYGITRRRVKISARLNGLLFSLFSGIQKIKLAGAEKRAFAQWAASYKEEGKLSYTPPMLLRIQPALTTLITGGGSVWIYLTAAGSGISAADFMVFQTAYGAMSAAFLAFIGMAVALAEIKPNLELIQPFLDATPETAVSRKAVEALSGQIEINDLTFRYDTGGPAILEHLSLKIRSGEYVAIVGKTGCGKSTLMRLLLGMEKPESGAIYYDGHDLEQLDLPSLRRHIGVVLQHGKLFPGDIFTNIILTSPWKTLEDAWEAARLAGIEEDIKAMPMGMHTMISEGGGGISGGQRQRLLIARAIVAKPGLLLFDEATSALDNLTQKRVADSLSRLSCTRLIIAHRLSTIRLCDRIVVMDQGHIIEEGNYESLMAARGAFYELAIRQTL